MPRFLVGIPFIVLVLFSGPTMTEPVSKPVQQQKWVPYAFADSKPGDAPAFFMALEDKETACADRPNPEECRELWEKLPSQTLPIGKSEVSYLADFGHGLQRVRISRSSLCAIAQEPDDKTSCEDYWWHFVRAKTDYI